MALCALAWSTVQAAEAPPRFDGLGNHSRKISTDSPDAQAYFDQGLAFLYGFNHDEAIRSFEYAATLDPDCAAIYWAISLANGPHINRPQVDEPHARAAWDALMKARKHIACASEVERDLIEALGKRYANPQPEDRKPLDEAYADAMRKVWQKYPDDADIGALFAEALMDLRPWDQWTTEAEPQPGTEEVLETLDAVLALDPNHPLALHLAIHAREASPHPELAAEAADRLRNLQPGLGHMVHMPSHIDVRLGNWQAAIEANEKAIAADAAYRAISQEQDFYRLYMAHNHHMLAYAAMMLGQNARSTEQIRRMLAEIPDKWLKANAPLADAMFSMPYEMHIRFGRWDAMLAEPEPGEHLPVTRVMRLFGRGVAYAAKKDVEKAKAEQKAFLEAKAALPPEALFVQNSAADVLEVAEKVLAGEILYREGKVDEAVAALREGVKKELSLKYTEPPDWLQPVRHVLGATLMDARMFAEAETVYREDLARHPHNGWSLFGLSESLRMQGKEDEAEAVRKEFEKAWQTADVELTSSCYCLPGR